MTTVELQRVAREIPPQSGATGWRITTLDAAADGASIYAVVPIIAHRLDGRPVFRGTQRDCNRLYELLTDEAPTLRGARDVSLPDAVTGGPEPKRALPEAPDGTADDRDRRPALLVRPSSPKGASTPRLCLGCGRPLSKSARPNRRTHDGACRIAAFRSHPAEEPGAADDTGAVTVSGPETGADDDATPRSVAEESPTASTAGPGELDAGPLRPFEASDRSPGDLALTPAADFEQPTATVSGSDTAAVPMSGTSSTTAVPDRGAFRGEAVQLVLPAPAP